MYSICKVIISIPRFNIYKINDLLGRIIIKFVKKI